MADWCGLAFNFCFNVYNCTDPCRQTLNKLDVNHDLLIHNSRDLLEKMERVRSRIRAAEGRMLPTDKVTKLLQDAQDKVNRLNNVLGNKETARRHHHQKCCGGCCYKNCCTAYKYAKEVEDLVSMLNPLLTAEEFGEGAQIWQILRPIPEGLQASTQQQDLVGMDGKFKEVWTLLDQQGFASIGIHGMGGVGKTSLLTEIHKKLINEEDGLSFDKDRVVWVEMSAVKNIPSARLAIGKKLGLLSSGDEVLQGQITAALKQKKFVLLLDDLPYVFVDEVDILAKIGVPINKNQNYKSKVVFTTRYPEVCYRMGAEQQMIQLECLEEGDPWILFQKVVGEETLNFHNDIRDLAWNLVNLCGGLPLALVTMGGTMKGKAINHWKLAINRLQKLNQEPYRHPDVPYDLDEKVFKVLQISYNSLPQTDINPSRCCFLYASLFPKSCLPEEEELIHYWIAEGILKEFDTLAGNLVPGRSMIESLQSANLLNPGNDSKTVKMHDMIRCAAHWIARKNFFVQSGVTSDQLPADIDWAEVVRISLIGNSIQKLTKFEFNKLSTLILKKSIVHEFGYDFFDCMPSLRVLDLSWCNVDSFPKSITLLHTLQYLNISHTHISALPIELKNLNKLKFLDLSYLDDLQLIPKSVLVSLTQLQSLNLYHSGFGKKIQESNTLPADQGSSSGGNVLAGDGVALLEELELLNHLDHLGLTVTSGLALETLQKSKKFKCLHSLSIAKCKGLSSLQVPSLDTAENLKVLRVDSCSFTICLERDAINRIRRRFQKLCDIEIEECWVLKDLSWLKHAPLLQLLKIDSCQQMEEVIINNEEPNEDSFSRLRSISLSKLPALKKFSNLTLTLPALEEITVLYCPKMEKLPLKAANAKGLKFIKTNKNLWDTLTWEEDVTESTFIQFCKFE